MQMDILEADLLEHVPADGSEKTLLLYGPESPTLVEALAQRGYLVQLMAHEPRSLGTPQHKLIVHDVDRAELQENYDVVICRQSSSQFRNPLKCLERFAVSARSLFLSVLEDPAFESNGEPFARVFWRSLLRKLPVLLLVPPNRKRAMDQAFALSTPLIMSFFKSMRQDFANIQVMERSGSPHRLLVAKKRTIGRLIVLAGVNAVGKSTFLQSLHSGKLPDIAHAIGMESPKDWEFTRYANLLSNEEQAHHENILVQYNITSPLVHGEMHGHHNGLLDLIKCARECIIVTMWLPHTEQRSRYFSDRVPSTIFSRELYMKRKKAKLSDRGSDKAVPQSIFSVFYFRSGYTRRKADRLLQIYASRENYSSMYQRWMGFAKRYGTKSLALMQGDQYSIVTGDEWQKISNASDEQVKSLAK
jgi:hypothetical protein